MRDILLKLIEAAEARAAELRELARSSDDRGAGPIDAVAARWAKLAEEGRGVLGGVA